jgi:hypothetical protein
VAQEDQTTQPMIETRPRKQDRATLALLAVAALIAIGGIGFAIGRASAPATSSNNGYDNAPFGGGRGMPSFAPGQSFNPGQYSGFRDVAAGVSGTVESIDSDSMTVKLANGSTVEIALTGDTTFHSETAASAADVQAGTTVRVQMATTAAPSESPSAGSSVQTGSRTLTAGDVLITSP